MVFVEGLQPRAYLEIAFGCMALLFGAFSTGGLLLFATQHGIDPLAFAAVAVLTLSFAAFGLIGIIHGVRLRNEGTQRPGRPI